MDLTLILTVVGIGLGAIIGGWQIVLARKQIKHDQKRPPSGILSMEPNTSLAAIKWQNSGNLFWLSHDLMLSYHLLIRNGPQNEIIFNLSQSLHHLRSLGFANIPVFAADSQLSALIFEIEHFGKDDLTRSRRDILAQDVSSVIKYIGTLAEAQQPDFVPYAPENQFIVERGFSNSTNKADYEKSTI